LEAVELPEEDAVPVVVADVVEFPRPEVAMAV
jgi:hypothetical protein